MNAKFHLREIPRTDLAANPVKGYPTTKCDLFNDPLVVGQVLGQALVGSDLGIAGVVVHAINSGRAHADLCIGATQSGSGYGAVIVLFGGAAIVFLVVVVVVD